MNLYRALSSEPMARQAQAQEWDDAEAGSQRPRAVFEMRGELVLLKWEMERHREETSGDAFCAVMRANAVAMACLSRLACASAYPE